MSKSNTVCSSDYIEQFRNNFYAFEEFPKEAKNDIGVIMGCVSCLENVAGSKSFLKTYMDSHNDEMKFYYQYKQLLPGISAYRLRRDLNEEYNVAVNRFILQFVDEKTFEQRDLLRQLVKKRVVFGIKNKRFYDSESAALDSVCVISENIRFFSEKALTPKVLLNYIVHVQLHCDERMGESFYLYDYKITRDVLKKARPRYLNNPDLAAEFIHLDERFKVFFDKRVLRKKAYVCSRMETGIADYLLSISDKEFIKAEKTIRKNLKLEYLLVPDNRFTSDYASSTNLDIILSEAEKLPHGAMDLMFGDEDTVEQILKDNNIKLSAERWRMLDSYLAPIEEYEVAQDQKDSVNASKRVDVPLGAPAN